MDVGAPKFSGGVQKANLMLSTGILREGWEFISMIQQSPRPISFAIRELGRFTILAFNSGSRGEDVPNLLSLDESHPLGFLITKDNPSIALDSFPLSTFSRLLQDLAKELQKLTDKKQQRLIVVGHSEGGAVAALFTLWLLKNRSSPELPLCITYGSPFIGNEGLQTAIGKIEQWKSQFWHVLSLEDPVISWCRSLLPSENDPAKQSKPFGTYLLLWKSGYDCIDDPKSVLELLSRISPDLKLPASSQTEPKDYGAMLLQLEQRTNYRKCNIQLAAFHDSLTVDENGVLLEKMLEEPHDTHINKCVAPTHNSRKLNNIKKKMAQLEWFKKDCETKSNSYYDVYRRAENYEAIDVLNNIKPVLFEYWKKEVTEAENKPQTRDAQMRDRWLFGGSNYRRMVEPLHIAEYYKKGCSNYLKQRHPHFAKLEEWEKADGAKKSHTGTKDDQKAGKSKASSLTHDSCFWARVEEAALKLRQLENGGEANKDIREELREFEDHVMKLVDNYQLSPDVFLEQSSFMVWWEQYSKVLKGEEPESAQDSRFIALMTSGGYKNYVRSAN